MLWLCIRLPALVSEALAANERAKRSSVWPPGPISGAAGSATASAARRRRSLRSPRRRCSGSSSVPAAPCSVAEALLQKIAADLTRLGLQPCLCARALAHRRRLAHAVARAARASHTRAQLRTRLEPLAAVVAGAAGSDSDGAALGGTAPHRRGAAAARRRDRAALWTRDGLYLRRLSAERQRSAAGLASAAAPIGRAASSVEELHETGCCCSPLQRLLLEFQGYLRGARLRGTALHARVRALPPARRAA